MPTLISPQGSVVTCSDEVAKGLLRFGWKRPAKQEPKAPAKRGRPKKDEK